MILSGMQRAHIHYKMGVVCLCLYVLYNCWCLAAVLNSFLSLFCSWSFFGSRKAVKIFGDDERFKAVERARDREDMFEEYLAELGKKVSFFWMGIHNNPWSYDDCVRVRTSASYLDLEWMSLHIELLLSNHALFLTSFLWAWFAGVLCGIWTSLLVIAFCFFV